MNTYTKTKKHNNFRLLTLALAALLPTLPAAYADAPAPDAMLVPAAHIRTAQDDTDQRIVDLADLVVEHLQIKKGEHVLLVATNVPDDLVVELVRSVRGADGIPHVRVEHPRIAQEMIAGKTDEQFSREAELLMAETKGMDVVIDLYGEFRPEAGRTPSTPNAKLVKKYLVPISVARHEECRWCHINWPTQLLADRVGAPLETLTDYYLECSLLDFDKLRPAMEKLKAMMEATDEVHIVGPGTDLTFSIKNIPVVAGYGMYNMPDGEVFTAPVRESVNGTVRINLPSVRGDLPFVGITLRFENGRLEEIITEDDFMKAMFMCVLGRDEDARYLGEFALGVNPLMFRPIFETLFDEKMAGSFHIALGCCIPLAPNGNDKTTEHWDLVIVQRPEAGGGEIYFDGKLISKDGQFLDPDLAPLNPIPHRKPIERK